MATQVPGAHFAYICLLLAVFVTSLYIFRAFFLTFHGKSHAEHTEQIREPRWVMLIPLIVLAIPSMVLGIILVKPILYAHTPLLSKAIYVAPDRDVLAQMAHEFHGVFDNIGHAFLTLPFWLSVAGIIVAWLCYVRLPELPGLVQRRVNIIYRILVDKYGFDVLTNLVFVRGSRKLSNTLYQVADMKLIDHNLVNGSGRGVTLLARVLRLGQSGYLYHYAFVMIVGLLALLVWMLLG